MKQKAPKPDKPKRPIDIVLELAKEQKMSKSKLASEMGVLPQHVTNWIKRGMPPEHHAKAAQVLGCSVDRVLGLVGKDSKQVKSCPHADIPQRRIDLIRMYGRLPDDVRQPIRALIETLAYMLHEHKGEYVTRVENVARSLATSEK